MVSLLSLVLIIETWSLEELTSGAGLLLLLPLLLPRPLRPITGGSDPMLWMLRSFITRTFSDLCLVSPRIV